MTTIAYRDGVIAYDSRVTCRDVAVYKNYDKSRFVDGVRFFITGNICDYDTLINDWFSSKHKGAGCGALVVDEKGDIFEVGYNNGKMWKEKLLKDQHVAIGSGWQFALMAMDLGLSAEDAVKKASERCIYTGGEVRVYKV
ncbi:MAG: hypothetical protein K2Q45_10990 [Nitrosomonas sp.]|nr:hypothetical protein [Nitrosomonas sp.]